MKLVVFNEGRPGVWTERGIVDVSKLVLPWGGHDGMRAIIERFDELQGIDWEWVSMDGAMTKAPLGGEKKRPQPD